MIVGIDPGFNGTGVARLTEAGELMDTALITPPPEHAAAFAERLRAAVVDFRRLGHSSGNTYVIEFPDRDDRKGEILDIFKPAALAGALAVACPGPVGFLLPYEWKGNVPKDVHNDRVLAALTKKELARFMAQGYTADTSHNVIDAIGLAKWRFNNPRFVSRFGMSSHSTRSRIRKARASGKF